MRHAIVDNRTGQVINVVEISAATVPLKVPTGQTIIACEDFVSKGDEYKNKIFKNKREKPKTVRSIDDIKKGRIRVIESVWREIFFDLRIPENVKNSFKAESIQAITAMDEAINLQEIKQALQYLKKYDFVKADYKAL